MQPARRVPITRTMSGPLRSVRGIAGEAIPAMSRVPACADIYNALTPKRPYHKPMSSGEALALMCCDVSAAFFPEPLAASART